MKPFKEAMLLAPKMGQGWLKACWLFLLVCIAVNLVPVLASAHVLKIDGTISGVLHVNPNDEPVSGVPTSYILFMDDSTSRFSLSGCNCTTTIKQNGINIISQALRTNAQTLPGGTITFPQPGVYDIIVIGTPIKPGAFQPFKLDYLERVTQGPVNNWSISTYLWFGLCFIVVGVSLLASWLGFRYNMNLG